ncbi:MAG TPA: ParA family protein [Ignavibacteriaceae bacterium]|jgi:chromosome partitioning protein|nr:MAG: Sporulation initiation inhibitor protein Soj [Ignavibacteria bacterium ADurb.Bin266]OQY72073.1 MAG: hypothetical protein B6D44_10935 [Ignavibacteriales bacterium UTCHB2]HQF43170.1 ParA family protein [Ignavibacteriaceae bacterium]HQI41277.1 ParA family protein [Ignavibacteriaceae bacterium]
MKLIVILNNKGGVGKTTSAVNLAYCISLLKKKVLLVDLDSAASASIHLGFDKTKKKFSTICDFIIDKNKSLKNYTQKYSENLDVIPSERLLSDFYQEVANDEDDKQLLQRNYFNSEYDFIFFDSPPNMGNLVFNSLSISDYVLIPAQVQFSAISGLYITLELVDKVRRYFNSRLKVLGLFATYFDRRIKLSEEIFKQLKEQFGDQLFDSTISINSKLIEAYNNEKTVVEYFPGAKGSLDYMNLAKEVLMRIN